MTDQPYSKPIFNKLNEKTKYKVSSWRTMQAKRLVLDNMARRKEFLKKQISVLNKEKSNLTSKIDS